VDDFPKLLNTCDICIFPAKNAVAARLEIPLALIEALSLGKPLITSNIKPLNELVCGGAGILVDYNPDSFSSHILNLLKNKQLRKKLGKNSKALSKTRFNKRKMVQSFNEMYKSL